MDGSGSKKTSQEQNLTVEMDLGQEEARREGDSGGSEGYFYLALRAGALRAWLPRLSEGREPRAVLWRLGFWTHRYSETSRSDASCMRSAGADFQLLHVAGGAIPRDTKTQAVCEYHCIPHQRAKSQRYCIVCIRAIDKRIQGCHSLVSRISLLITEISGVVLATAALFSASMSWD